MIKALVHIALSVFVLIGVVEAAPEIAAGGVQSVAAVADRTVLAQGSVFTVTGTGLAGDEAVAEVPYPQDLNGVSVALAAADGSAVVQAYIVDTAARRITAIVPSATPAGSYQVTVTNAGETSTGVTVTVAESSFGLATNTGLPGGGAQGWIVHDGVEPSALSFLNSAAPGATLQFTATGLGAIDTPDNEYPAEENRMDGVVLEIGDQEIPVGYIGRDPMRPGYDKVVVTLPRNLMQTGCLVAFSLKAGDVTLGSYTIPLVAKAPTPPSKGIPSPVRADGEELVAPLTGAVCSGLTGLTPEALATLAQGGDVIAGGMSLDRVSSKISMPGLSYSVSTDQFSGGFVRWTAAQYIDNLTRGQMLLNNLDANGCVVWDVPTTGGGVYVDAGDALSLAGPAWSTAIPRNTADPNVYSLTLNTAYTGISLPTLPGAANLPIAAGHYDLSGTGGTVVGPFSVSLDVSDPIAWTNQDLFVDTIDRNQDLVFSWTGGQPDDKIVASGTAHGPAPEDQTKLVTRAFLCVAKAQAGQIVVPAADLQRMPVIPTVLYTAPDGQAQFLSVSLAHSNPDEAGVFSAPLVGGGNTVSAAFRYGYTYAMGPLTMP